MKHKLLKSCLFLAFTLMTVTTGFSGYQIQEEGPQTTPGNVDENKGTGKDYHKVTFQNSATGKTTTRYYEDGYILSMADLADATSDDPNTMYVSGSHYLSWKAEGGTYAGQALSTHIEVTEDLILKGTATTYTNTVSASCLGANNTGFSSRTEETYQTTTLQSTYDETLDYGEQFVGAPDNIIRFVSEGYNISTSLYFKAVSAEHYTTGDLEGLWVYLRQSFKNGEYKSVTHVNQTQDDGFAYGSSINIKLSAKSGNENGYGKLSSISGTFQTKKFISDNADTTIGLSNPEANSSEGGIHKSTPYKSQTNSGTYTFNSSKNTHSTNYCANRIVLENDVIFTGDITIGGLTGYYGSNIDYSQSGYQGYINGTYCEIDLNGHDLIMTNDSHIISYGSITDSSRFETTNDTGTLVMLPNSNLQSPFVIEDVFLPLSAPVSYFNNNAPFNFYRCPYLDCKTIFYAGSHFQGEYKVDLAGLGDATMGIQGIINLIGSKTDASNNYLLLLQTGKIIRDVTYNNNFSAYSSNLYNQRISYSIANASLIFSNFVINFEVSSINATFDSRKYQFFIPFFYRVNVINSTVSLNQELVFMSGSSLYFDKNSTLILSYSNLLSQPGASGIDAQTYQTVGGLSFLDTFYYSLYSNSVSEKNACYPFYDNGNTNLMTNTTYTNLWKNLAKQPAYCDFDGTIVFSSAFDSSGNQIPQYHPFTLGGQFDIQNINDFRYKINQWNSAVSGSLKKIQLFTNYFMLGPNTAPNKTSIKLNYFYVRGFYTIPLMTRQNELLVDITTTDYSTKGISLPSSSGTSFIPSAPTSCYDSVSGLIETSSGNTYAFIPDYSWSHSWDKTDTANLYGTVNLATSYDQPNDLDGSFWQVTSHGNYISVSGNDYGDDLTFNRPLNVFYNGSFVFVQDSISGNTAKTKLYRFAGGNTGDARGRLYSLSYSNNIWTLSGAA